ncbi:hypothetical protein [Polaribacter sargassicola]|uniref:hypothetical protein n=1 Tax=Polaribacter sargassicola TaxID=2836891 RepID=UPI001F44CFAA|nr:hypothetical protein [Polaribacter sp. DS7-9]MCG1035390.1 hypothetical protein [Polaribacter sp. DS7-9]
MNFYKFISIILHPILVPTIGVFLYFLLIKNNFKSDQKITVIALIFGTTYFIPLIILILFKRIKLIKSFKAETIKERKIPIFLMILLFYLLGNTLINIVNLSDLGLLFFSTTLGLVIVYLLFIFNLKTSLHLLSLGISTGFFFVLNLIYNQNFTIIIIVSIILSGLLASSRLYLKAHTPTEVYTGYIIGFLCPIATFYLLQ